MVLLLSCNVNHPEIPSGEMRVLVLKEDGTPFKDSDANRFIVQYSGDSYSTAKPILNKDDSLIFRCSYGFPIYREGETLTDNDIKKAIDNDMWFAIKDTKEQDGYKTVKKTYKECYKSHTQNSHQRDNPLWCNYIYYCEVMLEKK